MEQKSNITVPVTNEVAKQSLDLAVDYSELGLDSFLDEGFLKEIPFVKSVVSCYNIASSVIDRHKVKKILTFFHEFHSKKIDPEKHQKFLIRFTEDKNYQRNVVETIVLMNERFLDIKKSKVYANLVKAHIEENLTWNELLEVSAVLDNIHPFGFEFLEKMSKAEHWGINKKDKDGEALMFACGIGHRYGTRFSITSLGQKLYNFGIYPLNH
jgi:hypothetical protein